MAFCYQRNFGVPTENVGPELLHSLMKDSEVVQKVALIRQVKGSNFSRNWLETPGYKYWYQRLRPEKRAALDKLRDEKKVEAYCDGMKRSLPLVIFIANYLELPNKNNEVGRWRQKAGVCLNGLCVMDLDHVVKSHDSRAAREYWRQIVAHLDLKEIGVLMAFISPSGDGLKVVFKARLEWGNLIDNQQEMAKLLGVSEFIDEKCKDGSRGHFLTTEEDLLYIDDEVFTYENKAFGEKYNEQYREGRTSPETSPDPSEGGEGLPVSIKHAEQSLPGRPSSPSGRSGEVYHGVPITAIIEKLLGGVVPGQGDRHEKMRDLAHLLRYVCDNSPKKVLEALKTQEWVMDLIAEGDPVEATVEGACKLRYGRRKPEVLVSALKELGETPPDLPEGEEGLPGRNGAVCSIDTGRPSPPSEGSGEVSGQVYEEWGKEIEDLFDEYPCLRAACDGIERPAYPAALFVSSAFMGTLMTRTWYHFYHRPQDERRLNYCIFIIGDPGSGKSFATRLYKLLAAPIAASDKVGNDAINKYKRDLKERGTSSKEQKKEALKQPDVIIRIHGTRTANGVFIEDMNKAVEMVGNKPVHLHMLTFDSELDSSTAASKGGQWIDKSTMELKAFHNEEDNQQYKNVDSVTGPFNVYWNFIYTGTPLSLHRKVTERNFGSGLSTRLAVIELPTNNFKMMALDKPQPNYAADEELVTWAYKLDKVSGELPIWPLVEHTWEWTRDHMAIAEVNDDHADALLLNRIAYYGIGIAVPYILMRHWDEWEESRTITFDDTDHRLCELVMNIQYRTQQHWFGEYARKYYDDKNSDPTIQRQRSSKTKRAYGLLPESFTLDDVVTYYECSRNSASVIAGRLVQDGVAAKLQRGRFRKIAKFL